MRLSLLRVAPVRGRSKLGMRSASRRPERGTSLSSRSVRWERRGTTRVGSRGRGRADLHLVSALRREGSARARERAWLPARGSAADGRSTHLFSTMARWVVRPESAGAPWPCSGAVGRRRRKYEPGPVGRRGKGATSALWRCCDEQGWVADRLEVDNFAGSRQGKGQPAVVAVFGEVRNAYRILDLVLMAGRARVQREGSRVGRGAQGGQR